MDETQKIHWLRLARSENVGPITFFRLIEKFGSAEKAIHALPNLTAHGIKGIPSVEAVEAELATVTKMGGRIIAAYENDYPEMLKNIADPPPVISTLGNVSFLHRKSIAIVGARNASANGKRLAEKLAHELGEAGLIVTSGLARGIDTAVHRGSLATGTIAAVASGLDIVYPEENIELFNRIAKDGTVIAECALGTEPHARQFPRRNRIIAGLSLGVVVVEAASQSGSLITARLANEQGKEIFAVPGSPLDSRCAGPNNLIRNGCATLVETAQDILDVIVPLAEKRIKPEPMVRKTDIEPSLFDETHQTSEAFKRVLEGLGPTPVQVDDLARQCELPVSTVMSILLELELAGRLQRLAGNQVALLGE